MIRQTSTFPKTYANISTTELLSAYDPGVQRIRAVLEGLSEAELKSRARGEDRWSIFEIVLHVTDSELMGAARVRQTFTQSGRDFAFYDQDVWTNRLNYRNLGLDALDQALQLFELLRKTTSMIFHCATEEDWNRTGIHAELGETSLRQLLELYADHSERHIQQILHIRQLLGKAMEFPMILTERLY
jgi:hypothetical protein